MSGHVDYVFHAHRDACQWTWVDPLGKPAVNQIGGFPGAAMVDDHKGLQLRIEVFRGSQGSIGNLSRRYLTGPDLAAQCGYDPRRTHSHRGSNPRTGSSV